MECKYLLKSTIYNLYNKSQVHSFGPRVFQFSVGTTSDPRSTRLGRSVLNNKEKEIQIRVISPSFVLSSQRNRSRMPLTQTLLTIFHIWCSTFHNSSLKSCLFSKVSSYILEATLSNTVDGLAARLPVCPDLLQTLPSCLRHPERCVQSP